MPYPAAFDVFNAPLNNWETTLSATINSSVTSIGLASVTGLPASGVLTIDNEIIYYASIAGTTLNGCVRAFTQDPSEAVSHSGGTKVERRLIANDVSTLQSSVSSLETYVGLYERLTSAGATFVEGASNQTLGTIFTIPTGYRFATIEYNVTRIMGAGASRFEKGTLDVIKYSTTGANLDQTNFTIDSTGTTPASTGATFAVTCSGDLAVLKYSVSVMASTTSLVFEGRITKMIG